MKTKIQSKYQFWKKFYKIRYEPALTARITNKEVRLIKEFLPLSKYKKILDFMCGSGRHALRLARLGYRIEGFDLDEESIRQAKKQIILQRLKNIKLYVQDALRFNKKNFDAAICIYSAIGCLNKKDNEKIFRNLFQSVRTGGRIILDFMNPNYARKYVIPSVVKIRKYKNKIYVIKHQRKILFNPIREKNILHVINRQAEKEYHVQYILHLYSVSELRQRLQKYGFVIKQMFGSFDKEKVDINHPRIIIIADRIQQKVEK